MNNFGGMKDAVWARPCANVSRNVTITLGGVTIIFPHFIGLESLSTMTKVTQVVGTSPGIGV